MYLRYDTLHIASPMVTHHMHHMSHIPLSSSSSTIPSHHLTSRNENGLDEPQIPWVPTTSPSTANRPELHGPYPERYFKTGYGGIGTYRSEGFHVGLLKKFNFQKIGGGYYG